MSLVTFEDIKNNKELKTYIEIGDKHLALKGYTKHDLGHVTKVSETAGYILKTLGFSKRDIELAKIAGFIHDIGNMVNREEHAQTGACLCFNILNRLGMEPEEIATLVSAVGNHDEDVGSPINPVSAALILGDKTDVRRSRVRNTDFATFDIHDRVNYAVEKANVKVDGVNKNIELELTIDTSICPLMEYFEIFITRMILCRKAADFLNTKFKLTMNGTKML
ncbi:HD domain-containing protein [Clostridium estertheticum]|uniref:HD domain-containing protein n=1 Tax=Clostridium estertheticum TaxID=238834 RepID=UPI0013E928D3|nr:HD domain-containing protein [Clostridium estertheticum]MBZ9686931.1 HD domain-containing protein [Clostridium estertheticum]